ncbi:MAG: hypothetical protein ACP5N9_03715 [Candidatus Bilamarchaeum sp.]
MSSLSVNNDERSVIEIAQHYLDKHRVPDDQFGLGPLITSDKFDLIALPTGGLFFKFTQGGVYHDCRSLSTRIYDDLIAAYPHLAPTMVRSESPDIHNWVEITDPKTAQIVQIDSTPWYNRLNPGHIGGSVSSSNFEVLGVPTGFDAALPYSTRRFGSDLVSVYFSGSMPNIPHCPPPLGRSIDFLFSFTGKKENRFFGTAPDFTVLILVPDASVFALGCAMSLPLEALDELNTFMLVNASAAGERLSKVPISMFFASPHSFVPEADVGTALRDAVLSFTGVFPKLKPHLPLAGSDDVIDVRKPDIALLEQAMKVYPQHLVRKRPIKIREAV